MNNHKRVLILSPHTDDAELGCGGCICKFIQQGYEIFWIVFSTAEDSLPDNFSPDTLVNEFKDVVSHLNIEKNSHYIFRFPVRKLSEYRQEILDILIDIKKRFNPTLVIGPSLNDIHQDHITVANEMVRAFKGSASILSYELPWNHINFETQFFIRLDECHVRQKINLLKFYKSQVKLKRHYFSDEFIKGLAVVRGSQVNHKYVEAFEVVRWII